MGKDREQAPARPAPEPFVSVILPHWNDAERLAACLAALAGQSYAAERFEVLVVDNGSDRPPSDTVAPWPRARMLAGSTIGSYAARNTGVSHAMGEILAFTDADCLPAPTWIEKGVHAVLAHPGCGAVGGSIEVFAADPSCPTAVELYECAAAFRQESTLARYGYLVTANLFVPREIFTEVGPFDARLTSGGDVVWCRRAQARGLALVYDPEVSVRHPARASWGPLVRKHQRVIGGDRDARRLKTPLAPGIELAKAAKAMLPPFRQFAFAVSTPRLRGLRERLLFAAVATVRHYVEPCERVRLLLGGQVRR